MAKPKMIRKIEEFDDGKAIRVSYVEIDETGGKNKAKKPKNLTVEQKAEWDRIMTILASEDLEKIIDGIALADHCRKNF